MAMQNGKDVKTAAALMLRAWNDPHTPLAALPEELRPENLAEAYAIQQAVNQELGAIGGWIVWKPESFDSLACAPLPLSSIRLSPAPLPGERWTFRRIVPRLCVRLGSSLPDYGAPYGRDQVVTAIESCHPAVEVRQPRFADAGAVDALTALADSNGYGCLVYARPGLPWRDADPDRGEVRIVAGDTALPARTMRPDFDVVEVVRALANDGARWAGGLAVGNMIAVGIGADEMQVAPDTPAEITVGGLGRVDVRFDSGGNHVRPAERGSGRFQQWWRALSRR